MQLTFYKYQGTGNDFIMVDNRQPFFPKEDTALIAKLCDRRFGIGADGLILLENETGYDFRMVYYNSDGNQSSMCGNGGRCIVAFAKALMAIGNEAHFIATDGPHHAVIAADGIVSLQMKDVDEVKIFETHTFLDTGSPHHVQIVNGLAGFDVKGNGAAIRYSELYGNAGSNVNFVSEKGDGIFSLRTYERGVEDETLSCGTGATAVAIAMHATGQTISRSVKLEVEGGLLEVAFDHADGHYTNVRLTGPAAFVFSGTINC